MLKHSSMLLGFMQTHEQKETTPRMEFLRLYLIFLLAPSSNPVLWEGWMRFG